MNYHYRNSKDDANTRYKSYTTSIGKNLNEIMKKENLFHTFLDKKMERIYQKKLISVFPFLSMLSDFRETQFLPAPNHFRPGTQILLRACSRVRVVCPR